MATAAVCLSTNSVISVSDLAVESGEPRIHDLRLSAALGFGRLHDIRSLIRRHLATLASFGEVCSKRNKPGERGGRPGTDYWLNEEQALFITAKSDTETAALVTVQMVRVFRDFLRGAAPAIAAKARRQPSPKRPPFTPSQKGRGVMMLDHLVYFDRRILPRAGDEVLVIDHANQPRVDRVADSSGEFKPGRVWVQVYDRPFRTRSHLALVGVVTTSAGMPKRIVAA